jgi:hypothetical protein
LGFQTSPNPPQAIELLSDDAGRVCRALIKQRNKLTGSFTVCGESFRSDDPAQFEQLSHDFSFFPICVVDCHQVPTAIPGG